MHLFGRKRRVKAGTSGNNPNGTARRAAKRAGKQVRSKPLATSIESPQAMESRLLAGLLALPLGDAEPNDAAGYSIFGLPAEAAEIRAARADDGESRHSPPPPRFYRLSA